MDSLLAHSLALLQHTHILLLTHWLRWLVSAVVDYQPDPRSQPRTRTSHVHGQKPPGIRLLATSFVCHFLLFWKVLSIYGFFANSREGDALPLFPPPPPLVSSMFRAHLVARRQGPDATVGLPGAVTYRYAMNPYQLCWEPPPLK
jgi:hypothetical protein